VVVDPETELDFLHDLPVELMWGVGPATRARLANIGVHTIGGLAKMPGWSLERIVGRATGEKQRRSHGIATHGRSRYIIEPSRPEPNQRSARSLLKSKFSDPRCVILPTGWTVGAALVMPGLTAWQGLFEHSRLQAGQSVLVHGAAVEAQSLARQTLYNEIWEYLRPTSSRR
jgi:hypothetical protein